MPSGQLLHSVAEWVWGWAQEHPTIQGWIVKIFKRPRLVLSCPLESDGWCHTVVACGDEVTAGLQNCRVTRVKIENTGRSAAAGCHVYIGTLSVNGAPAIARDLSNDLSWKDRESFDTVSLPPRIPAYVNVCFAMSDSRLLAFTTRAGLRGAHRYNADGDYEVRIRAEGDNFVSAGDITLQITFNRDNALGTLVRVVEARGNTRLA